MNERAWRRYRQLRELNDDRQGRRLGTLGKGVLVVLAMVTLGAFALAGVVIAYLIEREVPVYVLGAVVFGALAGIAQVVRAFGKPIDSVARIVEARQRGVRISSHR